MLGLFCMGLGVSLTTKSDLGTSPISAVPYVLSLICRLSFGEFTFFLSIVFLLIQVAVLRNDFARVQYLQILVGLVFGVFVDVAMFLSSSVHPRTYMEKILVLLLGNAVLALGVYLQVLAKVIINPGEGVVRAIAKKTGFRFGDVKVIFDSTLLTSAIVISTLAFRSVKGIREGSIISAFLVGSFTNAFAHFATRIDVTNRCLEYLAD